MKTRVLMVCLGNICRSPLAEGILRAQVLERELHQLIEIDSAGTSGHTAGSFPDSRSVEVARHHGIILEHRARQITPKDFDRFDHILVMDQSNLKNVLTLAETHYHHKVRLITDFDSRPNKPLIVPDPYYGDLSHFRAVHEQLVHCCEGWLREYFQNG